ncbi:MAG: tetratricopeptide repeat protein [Gemmatimonadetes bacterium]|nr:tetratricopeptide repeat protein [Gemmatimonadota bacterium]
MMLVVLPALFYGFMHILGLYYPLPVAVFFMLIVSVTAGVAAKDSWALRADETLARLLLDLRRALPAAIWLKAGLVLCCIPLTYAFRDQSHHLGDSAKWFAVLDHALLGSTSMETIPAHHSRLDIPGFEYVNFQQALDLLIHFQMFRLGHALWNWTSIDAYEWTSCLASGLYVLALWNIAFSLPLRTRDRLTLFAFLASLGLSQFFFGYGESYTLVTAVSALYMLYGLRHLQGTASIFYPTLLLLLAAALHLLSVSLFPSWLYLLWQDRGRIGFWCRQPRVYGPSLVVGVLLGAFAYTKFYSGLHMPLWQAAEVGQYAMLSIPHMANLANELLLLSPFGLIWGCVFLVGRKDFTCNGHFLGLAAVGAGGLIFVHYISMGGRDWDLMAFPGLFYSLWGFLCLGISPRREAYFRQVRWSVLPLMTMHTALWVGINHDTARAMDRLGNLLEYTPNQSLNYQYFVQGHYYLNLRQDNPERAEVYLRKAIAHTPDDDSGTLRRYRKYLGQTLVLRGDFAGAIAQFEKAFSNQQHPLMQQSDRNFHVAWVTAMVEEGLQRSREGQAAGLLWEEVIAHCRQILAMQPSARLLRLLGRGLLAKGQLDEATAACYESVELERSGEDQASTYMYLAESLQRSGNRQGAIDALKKSIHLDPDQPEMFYNLGNLHYAKEQFALAVQVYRQAIGLSDENARYHLHLALALRALADLPGAERGYRRAMELNADDVEGYLTLCRFYLDTEQTDKALSILRIIVAADFVGSSAAVYTQAGIDLYELGQINAAVGAYRKALRKDDRHQVARINLGWCLYLLKDLPAAIAANRLALLQQQNPQAKFNLGLVYLVSGDVERAQATYAQGVKEYGAETAVQIGAVDDLRDFIANEQQATEAAAILRKHWGG